MPTSRRSTSTFGPPRRRSRSWATVLKPRGVVRGGRTSQACRWPPRRRAVDSFAVGDEVGVVRQLRAELTRNLSAVPEVVRLHGPAVEEPDREPAAVVPAGRTGVVGGADPIG